MTVTVEPAAASTGVSGGLVTFRIGARQYATRLDDVREVVRLQGLADLPGMRPPLAGVVDLRGAALPVLDLRGSGSPDTGDVLVLTGSLLAAVGGGAGEALVGVAVDEVRAVVAARDLPAAGDGDAGVLPGYVERVLRGPDGVVFLVDLGAMVEAVRAAGPA
jgi:purine-binding chemotaxis protein CheW